MWGDPKEGKHQLAKAGVGSLWSTAQSQPTAYLRMIQKLKVVFTFLLILLNQKRNFMLWKLNLCEIQMFNVSK